MKKKCTWHLNPEKKINTFIDQSKSIENFLIDTKHMLSNLHIEPYIENNYILSSNYFFVDLIPIYKSELNKNLLSLSITMQNGDQIFEIIYDNLGGRSDDGLLNTQQINEDGTLGPCFHELFKNFDYYFGVNIPVVDLIPYEKSFLLKI